MDYNTGNFNDSPNNTEFNNQINSNQVNVNDYNNQSNNSSSIINNNSTKKNKSIIIVITSIAIVIILFFVGKTFLFAGDDNGNNSSVNLGQDLSIKNNITNITIKVESIDKNVDVVDNIFKDEITKFTKIKISVVNNSNKQAMLFNYNSFNLLDSNNNKIVFCTTNYGMSLYDVSDAIDYIVPANSSINGYLYCKTDSNDGSILEINSIKSIDAELFKEQKIIQSTDSESYYINLR